MNEEKRVTILHLLKKIAELVGEWEESDKKHKKTILDAVGKWYENDEKYRQMFLRSFDSLYKEIEEDTINDNPE